MDVTPDSREDWMVMNGLDDDFQTASSWLNEQRRTWFVGREVARIKTWAQNVRERVVRNAVAMATIAPALERVRWMPYKEDITSCPWPPGADCGDGDFVFDIIVQRPGSCGATTQLAADVEIGGGIRRVSRSVQCAGIASPRDAAEIPFGSLYSVEWAAEERVQSPVA
ncbi:hypothetical protein BS47DRAFT_321624 [Hydnum rufescens UP504]|uniref:Uncharacterized protein n=1 Tax=Hydnum rufescens UP504 TaxID=1448309 RepID=A0A9P6AKJ3_9AGAM|nr:hypothetical protein BS47DRAFT_321624 [Hydnum rufescens UP504]